MFGRIARAERWHPLLVAAVALAIYWPALGVPGLGSSEGHRIAPAWRMLDSGDWLRIEMFGQAYLRKPPGMPWAIAASSMVLGRTELGARAVSAASATLACLIAWWFAARWFGRPWGLAGGLAQALFPLLWLPGRSAEIESLTLLGTQIAALSAVELLRGSSVRGAGETACPVEKKEKGEGSQETGQAVAPRSVVGVVTVAIGVAIAGLAKGPAGLPCLMGVMAAACIDAKSLRPLRSAALWGGLGLGGCVIAAAVWQVIRASRGEAAVMQDFSEFTWSASRLWGVALLLPAALLAALPMSLALVVAGYGAWRGREEGKEGEIARVLALGWVISVLVLMVPGISNARYAMPSAVLLPPLMAWAAKAAFGAGAAALETRRLARALFLGRPAAWPALLVVGAAVWIPLDGARPGRAAGRREGRELAARLQDGAEVWADYLVEARPDALLYAQQAAREAGNQIEVRWRPDDLRGARMPPAADHPVYLLLRTDDSNEAAAYAAEVDAGRLTPQWSGRVSQYSFALYRVTTGED